MINNFFIWINVSGLIFIKIISDVVLLCFCNDIKEGVDVKDMVQYFDIFMDCMNFDMIVKNVINMIRDWDEGLVFYMFFVVFNSFFYIIVNQIMQKEDIQYYLDWLDYLVGVFRDDNVIVEKNKINSEILIGVDVFYMEELLF